MTRGALLISIRPKFAQMIFAGTKTVELRRTCPRVQKGDLALIYVSSPAMEIQGAFEVDGVVSAVPTALWTLVGEESGITKEEFLSYYQGKTLGHALKIRRAWRLPEVIGLPSLRRQSRGFQPPQSFRYVFSPTMPPSIGSRLEHASRN